MSTVGSVKGFGWKTDKNYDKYTNFAYFLLCVISAAMDSQVPIHATLQMLFDIASKYENFVEQKTAFLVV